MSEQLLHQILDKLTRLDDRMGSMEGRLDSLEGRMGGLEGRMGSLEGRLDSIEAEVKSIKSDTSDIPLIRRAVLETNDSVKKIEIAQKSFERKAISDLNTHSHSIDIINRRQLKLEAEVEGSKSR